MAASSEAIDARIDAADRLLTGQDGPADPFQAADLYQKEMAAGSGAAAARLAVLAAMGVARDADWNEALDLLAKAAELGDRSAQGQLAVLTGHDKLPGKTDWRAVRKGIDLAALLKPPIATGSRTKPSIVLMQGMASPQMCRWLIARAEARLERGKVLDYATGVQVPDPIRTGLSAGFGLVHTDLVMVVTQERLARVSKLVVHQQEAPNVLCYAPGQEYKAHFDFFNPGVPSYQNELAIMGQRVATCLTWLNDDYEGGETRFSKIGWQHRGKAGEAMLFLNVTTQLQPDPLTLHAGLPVTRGRKWMLSQWVRDRVQPIV